jgi:hypothetical protein
MKCNQDFSQTAPRETCAVVFRWDNSFSLLTQKCIHYRIRLFEKEKEAGECDSNSTEEGGGGIEQTMDEGQSRDAQVVHQDEAQVVEQDDDDKIPGDWGDDDGEDGNEELDLMARLDKMEERKATDSVEDLNNQLDQMLGDDGDGTKDEGESTGPAEDETIFVGGGGNISEGGMRKR